MEGTMLEPWKAPGRSRACCLSPTQHSSTASTGASAYTHGSATSPPPGPWRKSKASARRHSVTTVACFSCQQRKSKCDGIRPSCTPCRKSDYLIDCHYELPNGTKRSVYLKRGIADTELENTRLKELILLQRSSSEHSDQAATVRYEIANLINNVFRKIEDVLCRIQSSIRVQPETSDTTRNAESTQQYNIFSQGSERTSPRTQVDTNSYSSEFPSPSSAMSRPYKVPECSSVHLLPSNEAMIHLMNPSQHSRRPPAYTPLHHISFRDHHQAWSELASPTSTISGEQLYFFGGHVPVASVTEVTAFPEYCQTLVSDPACVTRLDVYPQWIYSMHSDSDVFQPADLSVDFHGLQAHPSNSSKDTSIDWTMSTPLELDLKASFRQKWSESTAWAGPDLVSMPLDISLQPHQLFPNAIHYRLQEEYGHSHKLHGTNPPAII